MAKICPVCDKSSMMVTKRKLLRGHYNPTTKRKKYPNLQWAPLSLVKLRYGNKIGAPKGARVKICAQCIRGLSKTK